MMFSEFPLHERVLKALEKMSFTEPTPVQRAVLPEALAGRDLVVSAKTGSGKTAAFMLPIIQTFHACAKPRSDLRALIVVPTRELALQSVKSFESLAAFTRLRCTAVIGGEAFKHQIASLRRNPELVVGTPGRLAEHAQKGHLVLNDLEFLVFDEADRMLDMGFAEDLQQLTRAIRGECQRFMFSATLGYRALGRLQRDMRDPVILEVDKHSDLPAQLRQQRVLSDDDEHKTKLCVALLQFEEPKRCFIFCNTRSQVQKLSNVLRAHKLRADYLHGEISQSARKQVLARYLDGKTAILVATDVAARGLDIDDVELVINFDVAHSGDAHVHRVGRTGRAEKAGLAVTLVNAGEWNRASSIERYLKMRFEDRTLPGLAAKYTGPKKLKSSGKAASTKKRTKTANSKASNKKTVKPQAKKKPIKRFNSLSELP